MREISSIGGFWLLAFFSSILLLFISGNFLSLDHCFCFFFSKYCIVLWMQYAFIFYFIFLLNSGMIISSSSFIPFFCRFENEIIEGIFHFTGFIAWWSEYFDLFGSVIIQKINQVPGLKDIILRDKIWVSQLLVCNKWNEIK